MKPAMAQRQASGAVPGESEPLLAGTREVFVTRRKRNDVAWGYAYAVILALAVAGGIYAACNRNPAFITSLQSLDDPATCPLETHARGLKQVREAPTTAMDALMAHAVSWSAGTLLGSLGLGLLFTTLVKYSARALVNTAVAIQIGLPLGGALSLLLAGQVVGGVLLLLLAGLLIWTFYLWRDQIKLVTRLLGLSGHALIECPGLVGLAVGLQMLLTVLVVPLLAGGVAAYANGHVVYNAARQQHSLPPADSAGPGRALMQAGALQKSDPPAPACTNLDGDGVICCMWEADAWVPPYMALLGLALTWTTFLLFEVKVFAVSGTIAQWYFAATSMAAPRRSSTSRVGTSLGHALGPQFGSLCFSSAILTLVSYLRSAMENMKKNSRNSLLAGIVSCLADLVYSLIEFLTKFATVQMAMTGQAFIPAAHGVVDLLRRNFLDAFGVWWLPPLILQNCAFVAAAAFGGAMWFAGYLSLSNLPAPAGDAAGSAGSPAAVSWLLAGIAFVCAWMVLAFFVALLLNVVDALFLCFALDRDQRAVTKQEVHEVLCSLPSVGPVIEQPGGEVAYGLPGAAPRPPAAMVQSVPSHAIPASTC